MYMVKLTLLLSCAMNFHKYPHDGQLCKMSMESLSHTTEDLVFEWLPENDTPLVVDEGIELPQLELIQNYTADCTTNYSTGTFTCLEVVFKFKRRLGYFMFQTYIPTCLIVKMSWISFWIKPEAVPARVTLGVTSLLTLSTQHANSQKSLPPVSYIKAIDVFMSGCTVFVFLSLIEYALVNIVMGDIADIEKKKSMGISNLILGSRGLPIRQKEGGLNQEEVLKFSSMQEQRSFSNFFKLNRSNGSNSIPMTTTGISPVSGNTSVPNPPPPPANLNVSNLMGNNASCVHSQRNSAALHNLQQNHIDHAPATAALLDEAAVQAASHTPYFMNRDGCVETA